MGKGFKADSEHYSAEHGAATPYSCLFFCVCHRMYYLLLHISSCKLQGSKDLFALFIAVHPELRAVLAQSGHVIGISRMRGLMN